ncbi:tripartite tricarboxylate transporter substrate binding protein [Thermaerobacter sp. PB12/4term]|uniref:tripartite tricarboxylate transporter substrate binding protein n=1 Tax=Thermaerobacter sp. PB12/4term TaxID=2293838 RepID=UPI000E32B5AD|nr:tripartite tricarboxylate transporter substrate binding protein [Thermaerobacter sp. PB12/4term]QIA26767.1 tripartite tricarboxylate transporter substrate binding protein [Thermaerobacter sp. PB12/4term]
MGSGIRTQPPAWGAGPSSLGPALPPAGEHRRRWRPAGWRRLAGLAVLVLVLALAGCSAAGGTGGAAPGGGAAAAGSSPGGGGAGSGGEAAGGAGAGGARGPLTYLVCFDPGGQSDIEARRQQPHLERLLGRQVAIEYKVGGGGALCWSELVRSRPDGSVVAGINLPHIILQPLQQQTGYRTEQIEPVVLFQSTPLGLAVPASSPYRTLDEFIAAAKANPGAITVGGSGTFSGHHVATVRLEKLAGIDLTYVPFSGAAPQITAFLGGHVAAVFANSNDLVKYRDRIRVLGIAADERFPGLPGAPTFKEQGIDLVERIDRGVGVPAGTPPQVIAELEKAFLTIARDPAIRAQMEEQGFVPLAMGHAESKAYIEHVTATYKALVQDLEQ